ncbi:MAG TPA: oligosaccharide flippase family protein [Chloroflexota bacterium]|nr:oligosaccharide flippase family protein [Chloroflexota bacterium]
MDASRALVGHVAVLLSSQVVTSLLGFLTVLLLPVYLGDVGLGRLAFAQSVCTVLGALTVAGTNLYIVREVAIDRRRSSELLAAGLVLRAPLWAIFAFAVWAFLNFRGTSRDAMLVLGALLAVTLVNVLNGVFASALQGLEQMRWRSVAAVASSVVVLVVGLPLLLWTRSPFWFCAALLAGALVGLGINAAYFVGRGLTLALPPRAAYRQLAIGAAPFLALAVSQGFYSQIDTILTGLLTNEATVGWFAAAARLGTAVLLVPVVMTSALFPVMSRLATTQPAAAFESMRRMLQTVLLMAMPLAAGLSAIGSPLFAFLHYPSSFSHSVPILIVLSASWILTAVVMVLGCAVIASGRQRAWAVASLGLLGLFGVLNLALIPLAQWLWANGGIGGALANFFGELAFVIVALTLVPGRVFGWRDAGYAGRVILASLLMVVVVLASSGWWLPLSIATGAVAYVLFSVALKTLTPADAKLVLRLLRESGSESVPEAPGQLASSGVKTTVMAPAEPIAS